MGKKVLNKQPKISQILRKADFIKKETENKQTKNPKPNSPENYPWHLPLFFFFFLLSYFYNKKTY